MARRLSLTTASRADIGERLLGSKLQILSGTGDRRPSIALSVLTGRLADQASMLERLEPVQPLLTAAPEPHPVTAQVAVNRPHLLARTVYLTEAHLRDIEAIIQAWQPGECRRLTRSAVLRRAVEHLRGVVEADPANSLLESH